MGLGSIYCDWIPVGPRGNALLCIGVGLETDAVSYYLLRQKADKKHLKVFSTGQLLDSYSQVDFESFKVAQIEFIKVNHTSRRLIDLEVEITRLLNKEQQKCLNT